MTWYDRAIIYTAAVLMVLNLDFDRLTKDTLPLFRPLLKNRSRYCFCYGSAGSGKSHFVAQKYLLRTFAAMSQGKQHRFLALRKTQPAMRKSFYALLNNYIDAWGARPIVKENKTDMTLTFKGGSQFICGGLDDPAKIKSIEGVTGVILEELPEFSYEDFRQVDLRLRGNTPSYKQITAMFNPVSRQSWVYKRLFEAKNLDDLFAGTHTTTTAVGKGVISSDATYHHSTFRNNPHLDEEYQAMLEGLRAEDSTLADIYAEGIWGVLKNLIIQSFVVIPDREWPHDFEDEYYGLDFGYNAPSALINIGIIDEQPWEEELIYQTKLTNTQLIEMMKEKIPESKRGLPIFADSAEPDRIDEICAAGFYCMPSDKAVKQGLDFLRRRKHHIRQSSTNILAERESFKYKEDRASGEPTDEPVKFMDHTWDAIRYAEFTRSKETMPGLVAIK